MTMHTSAKASSIALAIGITASALFLAAPVAAGSWTSTVIATGLDNPRGLAFGPDGALYVAEAGRYAPGGPSTIIRGVENFYADTGAITRIQGGTQTRFLSGLPSLADATSGAATGPTDIAFDAMGHGYVVVGLGWDPAVRTTDLAPVGQNLGLVYRFDAMGTTAVGDISAYELAFNPVGGPVDSNPYQQTASNGALYMTDAGSNTVLRLADDGTVSLLAAFPPRFIGPPPPFSDSVPTGIVAGPDGNLYVSELTGFPFTPGAAQIYRITPEGVVDVAHTGFTMISDLAFGRDGSLFVLELDSNGFAQPGGTGQIIRILPDGGRRLVIDGLVAPTGLTVGPKGRLYVSNFGPTTGLGQVLELAYVPEPATWGMMILGFGAVGMMARRRRVHASLGAGTA
jgi:hypothetical protein